jgi:UDP-2-acetamido-3-amino-2,3-dideoxy-glucuronate N-acetyltransferase
VSSSFFVHPSAIVDEPCRIGEGTKIWHFCHVSKNARLGQRCSLGQNVYIGDEVEIGDNVKIQNNVSVYTGTVVEDDVFLGPSCVLTNVSNPRAQVLRKRLYEKTLLRRGCSIGANATVVCGITIGRYAFVAAGAVVTKDVPDYALIAGVPGRRIGYMSRHGYRLEGPDKAGLWRCPVRGWRYREENHVLRCLDLAEDQALPATESEGSLSYQEFRTRRGA